MKKISNSSKGIMTTSIRRGIKKSIPLYILLLPSAVLLFCFAYLPMYGLIIAFKDYSPGLGIMGSPWVGLKHFIKFFNSYQFGLTLKNTLSISVYGIIVGFPLPIALALMCNQIRNQKFKKVFQVTTYLPHFISTMVMCGLILIFLSPSSGIIANFFKLFDIQIPNFMASVTAFKHVYVWSDIWQHLGWDSIIYLAALSAIDPTYYEAATIDGASTMQKIRYIDLPLIISTAMILLILRAGGILSIGFEKALLLQNIQNGMGSEIISTYVYKVGMQSFQYSLSTAIGLFNTVVNFAVLLVVNWFSKKTTGAGLI
ncbi:MAG: ABC-type polysaccharide transport system, permease component [Anaerocolumna sp.]|jgi:putative aldouronate transport system permease protein|nr:ABC-type polysaccharide transport system, permease component [Anaerocolumna sp.]